MNKEIQSIIQGLQSTIEGEPWFGRSVYSILDEIDSAIVFKKPNENSHSLIDLLYHMNIWTEFTLKRIEKEQINDLEAFEKMDWRAIDPAVHIWKKGVAEFKTLNKKIIQLLNKKEDAFLKQTVDYRKYDFAFLLKGLIQHHIYHLGQIAYLKKLLA